MIAPSYKCSEGSGKQLSLEMCTGGAHIVGSVPPVSLGTVEYKYPRITVPPAHLSLGMCTH